MRKTFKQALSWFADQDRSWSEVRDKFPWPSYQTWAAVVERGWVDMVNHPHLDELWFITDKGREALGRN